MGKSLKTKVLVISAVNFTEGGPLTILRDCLASASHYLPSDWKIVALVHDKGLVNAARVKLISVPNAKSSWIKRLYYEWVVFRKISKKLKPDLWFSLHDITPRVISRRQVVYCHNPSPFYKLSLREAIFEPKFLIFNLFYKYLYGVFINRNHWVVVQQDWLRDAFKKLFGSLPIIVAYPSVNITKSSEVVAQSERPVIFFYPALPRVFKNFEVIGEAARVLAERGVSGFEIRITISPNENRYSKWLYSEYGRVPNLHFIGRQDRLGVSRNYQAASTLLFPSKLETWGLPISEAKAYKKRILVADLPYGKETVGNYQNVTFFEPTNAVMLADLIQEITESKLQQLGNIASEPSEPFAANWANLWPKMIEGL
ncbi:glycosyl transferases group 1 [mine drainage metagenome]|uniref:Glycosyl transferases group 1 n=1 Tax=mine drainage metagenome TaxID=410659 RepID=A0A1J5S088_9ZZZZ